MHRKLALLSLLAPAALALGLLAGSATAQAAPVDRDVFSAGGDVRTTAPVLGDFTATGGNVLVEHAVNGDASLAGGSVEVKAPIGDDLHVAGGDVTLSSTVGGDVIAVGGKVILAPAAVVARDASLHASKIKLEGRIDGDLQANGDRIVIDGEVRGDASLRAARIELGPKARILGELHYQANGELVRAEGATVLGAITRDDKPWVRSRERREEAARELRGLRWIGGVAAYLLVLMVAALFLVVAPVFGAAAAQRVRTTPWSSLGLGLATLLAVPMVAVLLFVTLLGIPLALAGLALYPVVVLLGLVVSVLFVARVLPPAFRLPSPQSVGATLGWFAAALLLVMVVARIPFLGPVLLLFFALAGLGAGVLELWARRKGPRAPNGGARAGTPASPQSRGDDMAGVQA